MLRVIVFVVMFSTLPAVAHAQKRVALVVGNSAYQHAGVLANPKNDAADVAAVLKSLGLTVIEGLDLSKAAFDAKVREFAKALQGAEVGVLFYAGHGLQVAGQNYLVPVDAELTTTSALEFEMVRVDVLQRIMEAEASANILFLDACRDNPLARNLARALGTRSSSIGRGLATIESGSGTLISFSTQPGNVALDGTGRNSPFAGALVKHMSASTDDVSAVLISVRNDVMKETQRKQVPWEHSALTGRVYFGSSPIALPPVSGEAERTWALVKDTTDIADLEAFRQQYGKAFPFHDRMAEKRIGELKKQQAALPAPPSKRIEGVPSMVGNYEIKPRVFVDGIFIATPQISIDRANPAGGISMCAGYCNNSLGCTAFSVNLTYGTCSLYGNVRSQTVGNDHISGVRK